MGDGEKGWREWREMERDGESDGERDGERGEAGGIDGECRE